MSFKNKDARLSLSLFTMPACISLYIIDRPSDPGNATRAGEGDKVGFSSFGVVTDWQESDEDVMDSSDIECLLVEVKLAEKDGVCFIWVVGEDAMRTRSHRCFRAASSRSC